MNNSIEVSIIVPVYNVVDYIDECLNSLVNQTFTGIEILIVVRDSTDGSTEKCYEWAEKDSRIHVHKAEIFGLGEQRNQGIRQARGKYIVFVDSDDWVSNVYVQRLYEKIVSCNADMVECDFYRVWNGIKDYHECTEIMGRELGIYEKLLLGSAATWKAIYNREFLLVNQIFQPNLPSQDIAVYPQLLYLAKRVAGVPEPLYFYRKDRIGNISADISIDNYKKRAAAFRYMLDDCQKRGLFEQHKKELSDYLRRMFSAFISNAVGKVNDDEYHAIKEVFETLYYEYFGYPDIKSEMLLGSFNLTRIVCKLSVLEDNYNRVLFSSLVGLFSPKKTIYDFSHPHKYREFMVGREIEGGFKQEFIEKKPEYFFFDLIEERYDIVCVNECYYTKSEAYDGAKIEFDSTVRIISRKSEECNGLWEKACIEFMTLLLKYLEPNHIYMIENYLTEAYCDGKSIETYQNIDEIQETNLILRNYYEYIKTHYPQIKVVKAYKMDNYVTDKSYRYGCYPWYLNEWVNCQIAESICLEVANEKY